MKRISIPKYLQKRKIELLRKKIISRKFGYMFYRKTVSKILPSQAQKYYLRSLVRKSFNIWFSHWYDITIGWKHSLRAEIHHNLKIQQTYFELWKRFCHVRKKSLMKEGIAMLHYEKHKKGFQLKFCFQKWKIYILYRRLKQRRLDYAWNHFKAKHYPGLLRIYFYRWMALVKVAQRGKSKIIKARQLNEFRLLRICFRELVIYQVSKVRKRKKMLGIQRHYEQKTLFNCFCHWKEYLQARIKSKMNMLLAQATYLFKLKRFGFNQLHRNAVRGKLIREVFKALNISYKRKYFEKWMIFVKKQRENSLKFEMYINIRKIRVKLNVLQLLGTYAKCRQEKRRHFQAKVLETTVYLVKSKLRFCLAKWQIFARIKKSRAVKAIKLFKLNNQKTLQRHLLAWRTFTRYKKHRRQRNCRALKHYRTSSQKACFTKILSNVIAAKKLKGRIDQARVFYRANLVEEAVRVIALAGIREKDKLLNRSVEKVSRELFIAQKYISIWKNNTFYKRLPTKESHKRTGTFCESEEIFRPKLEWFEMRVLLPRVLS